MGALAGALMFAQEPGTPPGPGPGPENGAPDVPARAARLSFTSGTVSFQPGSVDDWVPADVNRPMTTGDRLWTEEGSRAEVHLGSAAIRLNGRTNFSFINLDDHTAQMQLSMGTVSVRVRRLADDEVVEIDTPQAALSLLRPGEYRVEVNEQGDTTLVSVRSGQAEATAGQAFSINPRQQVRIAADPNGGQQPVFDTRDVPPADPFDLFCQDRDRREDMSQSAKYVSRDMPGYADLDAAGTWRQTPEYGAVWVPAGMPPGWAPYRSGHWAWVEPWGWTWIDDAPWGYAPFHYGRWVFVGGTWAWVPGPVAVGVRPVYAPALVAWVGGPGLGVGVGIGGPAVGWFALGPREVFVPAYAYSPAYIERVNVTNTVIVNRAVFANVAVANVTYVNRGVVGAVVVVPGGAMVAGRPIAAAAVVVRPEMIARVQVGFVAAVVPERGAVLGGAAVVRVAPPAAVMNRVVVTRTPPPPPRVAFANERAALAANPGHPLSHAAVENIRRTQPEAARQSFRTVSAPAARTAPANRPMNAERPAENRPAPAARENAPAPAARPTENRPAPAAPAARPNEQHSTASRSNDRKKDTKKKEKDTKEK